MKDARENNTPCLIEVKTYRYRGHSMSDPALYRTQDEVEKYKQTDPILMLKAAMLKDGFNEAELDAIDEAARKESKDSVEFAANSPAPENNELRTDIYAQPWDDSERLLLPRVPRQS
jgi:pyruvate dehydrogenase E1 component alpha subunit